MAGRLREDIGLLFSERGTMGGRPSRGRSLRIILFKAGVHAVFLYRIYGYLHRRGLRFLPELLSRINYFLTGAEIDPGAVIGGALRMPHPAGVVIGRGVRIGDNVSILSGVVLGGSGRGIVSPGKEDGYPEIGDGCWIFAGAKVLGPIRVGRDSLIGANAVLTDSVAAGSIVSGPRVTIRSGEEPARGDGEGDEILEELARLKRRADQLERRLEAAEGTLQARRGSRPRA